MNPPDAINQAKNSVLARALRMHAACALLLVTGCAWFGAHLALGIAIGAALGAANLAVVAWAAARLVGPHGPSRLLAQVLLALKLVLTCTLVAAVLVWLRPSPAGLALGWTSALVAIALAAVPARAAAAGPGAALSAG